ncbi:MAG: Sec-independent protein translocase protein TatB [Gammaproteobacteria bacterium]
MFDIGFSELCMVALVSLLVIGPERLPKAARIAGYWLGKTRAMLSAVKAEIREELRAEEIRQALKHEAGVGEFRQLFDEAADTVDTFQQTIERVKNESVESLADRHEPD